MFLLETRNSILVSNVSNMLENNICTTSETTCLARNLEHVPAN